MKHILSILLVACTVSCKEKPKQQLNTAKRDPYANDAHINIGPGANPTDDFKRAIATNDTRYVACKCLEEGRLVLFFTGLGKDTTLHTKHGYKIIAGSENYTNRYDNPATVYAGAYNRLLTQHLTGILPPDYSGRGIARPTAKRLSDNQSEVDSTIFESQIKRAAKESIDGLWINTGTTIISFPKIEISGTQFTRWTKTGPYNTERVEVKHGPFDLVLLGNSVDDKSPNKHGYATEDGKFADTIYVMRQVGELLVVEIITIFKDHSGRANTLHTFTFRRQP